MRSFDLVVIGAGQGSDPLARAFSEAGKTAAIVERDLVGGSCVNWGCTPTKTYAFAARVAWLARRAERYGVRTGDVGFDLKTLKARKDGIVHDFREGTTKKIQSHRGVELIRGEARFTGPKTLRVGPEEITGDTVVIDTGSRPMIPDIAGLNDVPYLTARTLLDLETLPGHLLILGAGYIGTEFAQSFRRFGSEVTLIEQGERILSREDPDVTDAMEAFLKEEGVGIEFCTKVERVEGTDEGIAVTLQGRTLRGTHLLVATSQCPNVEALDLTVAGIEQDEKGYVKTDARLKTTADGVYAIGDVKGGPAFTHISYDDYRVLRDNLLRGHDRTIEDRPVPYCVFTDPQLGRIGLSESEAKEKGVAHKVARLDMADLGRPVETGETTGFFKALVDPETLEILGAACLSIEGGEVMAMIELAMQGGRTARDLANTVLAHPTMAEGLNNLFLDFR